MRKNTSTCDLEDIKDYKIVIEERKARFSKKWSVFRSFLGSVTCNIDHLILFSTLLAFLLLI